MNYYNEFDPKAAAWLRELIKQKQIPNGIVDERSILEIKPHELTEYPQCHFFAGIGGWLLALQLAGWPADQPVWTGSCPCQPFSSAGKQLGDKDERHLWPAFFNLIRECRPDVVFGEQVASAIGKGWLDGISSDLEAKGYSCGAAVLGAHSVGAPHIRQRLYWVADSASGGFSEPKQLRSLSGETNGERASNSSGNDAGDGRLGNSNGAGQSPRDGESVANESQSEQFMHSSFWSDNDQFSCTDGKARRIEPGTFPLANGVSGRVGLLRGYGNAIVPQVAQAFIEAFIACQNDEI